MKLQVKQLLESVAVVAAANGVVLTAQNIAIWVQITLGFISAIWIALQASKFMLTWIREEMIKTQEARRKAKKPPTDFGGLESSGD